MTTTTVPEESIVTCDACKKECGKEPGQVSRLQSGQLILKRDALDWHNIPCADATVKLDLCDDCMARIGKAINAEAEAIRGCSPTRLCECPQEGQCLGMLSAGQVCAAVPAPSSVSHEVTPAVGLVNPMTGIGVATGAAACVPNDVTPLEGPPDAVAQPDFYEHWLNELAQECFGDERPQNWVAKLALLYEHWLNVLAQECFGDERPQNWVAKLALRVRDLNRAATPSSDVNTDWKECQ